MVKLNQKIIEDLLPLTPLQEGILFHYLRVPGGDHYFEQLSLAIAGEIQKELFKKSWAFVTRTNEMLRTVFRWEMVENPIQVILKEHQPYCEYYDIAGENTGGARKRLEEIKFNDLKKKFDLREVPFRIKLCKMGENKYEMIISSHHILYDGWSCGVLLQEFFSAYTHLSRGKALREPVKAKFKDFIKWGQNQDKKEQEKFWSEYLKGFTVQGGLPVKKSGRGDSASIRSGHFQVELGEDIKGRLEAVVKSSGIGLASFLFCAWGVLLQKYNNGNDVVFGTTVAGRPARIGGIEEVVGLFINTLPLRVQTYAHEKIAGLLHRIDSFLPLWETYEATPLVDIKKYSEIDNREELFDSVFVLENYPLASRLGEKASRFSLQVDSFSMVEATHYDLTVTALVLTGIELKIMYNKEALAEETARRLAGHFQRVLEQMVRQPGKEISKIEIITGPEKEQLLKVFNDTTAHYGNEQTLGELFVKQVQRTPDHIALVGHSVGHRAPSPEYSAITYR